MKKYFKKDLERSDLLVAALVILITGTVFSLMVPGGIGPALIRLGVGFVLQYSTLKVIDYIPSLKGKDVAFHQAMWGVVWLMGLPLMPIVLGGSGMRTGGYDWTDVVFFYAGHFIK